MITIIRLQYVLQFFTAMKMINLRRKIVIFLFFFVAQNIDGGYTLELSH